jgi:hypothetical protein
MTSKGVDMNLSKFPIRTVIIILLLFAGYLYYRTPSTDAIFSDMKIDPAKGIFEYKNIKYTAEWGNRKIYAGDIRYIGRAYDKFAPYITYEAVLTTGEFSDPSIVEVTPIRNGCMSWRSEKQPKGTLIVLHFIPADIEAHFGLKNLEQWQTVRLTGREELDSRITGSDETLVGLGHGNHKFFLVENVEVVGNKGTQY